MDDVGLAGRPDHVADRRDLVDARATSERKDWNFPKSAVGAAEEIRTLIVFAVTATLWITRNEPYGGWSGWLGLEGANDASVAMLAVVAMHLIPNGKGESLLTWETAVKIPWGVLILYGGGITIAHAFQQSGLSQWIGESLRCSLQRAHHCHDLDGLSGGHVSDRSHQQHSDRIVTVADSRGLRLGGQNRSQIDHDSRDHQLQFRFHAARCDSAKRDRL